MAVAEPVPAGRVPEDTFGNRIALIRAEQGWNYRQASAVCGVSPENWRLWEKTDRKPHDYEAVCRKIADASGYDRTWVNAGGPLSIRCNTVRPVGFDGLPAQLELAYESRRPALELVGSDRNLSV